MLTIGEFSRLARVSSRMLRHYDMLGLLRPEQVGENGYRYYEEAQLARLQRIERLKGYGFSLTEVGELIDLAEPELALHMHRRRIRAFEELHHQQKKLRHLEQQLMNMEETGMMQEKYNVILMEQPPQRIFAMRRTIHIGQTHELFTDMKAEAKRLGLTRTGATQQIYHGEEFSYESMDVEAQMEVSGDAEGVYTMPGGLCAAVTHTGPYDTLRYAYDALCAWMAEHPEYEVRGPAIERYIKDEGMVDSSEELETGVLFQVQRKG